MTKTVLDGAADASSYWRNESDDYIAALATPYHRHRMSVIKELMPAELLSPNARVFDFGCGEGEMLLELCKSGGAPSGCDPSQVMIDVARRELEQSGFDPEIAIAGGVQVLEQIESDSLDGVITFNVLAYLTDEEEQAFYKELERTVKRGGYFVATHSNSLFDLYALNGLTVDFLSSHLCTEAGHAERLSALITNSDQRPKNVYNVRENPLAYRFKLNEFGFEERRQEFINMHPLPPALFESSDQSRLFTDTLSVAESERWKLMFVCSTFGSMSCKVA